jgi:putative salt-induced outer membrane protein YdiY
LLWKVKQPEYHSSQVLRGRLFRKAGKRRCTDIDMTRNFSSRGVKPGLAVSWCLIIALGLPLAARAQTVIATNTVTTTTVTESVTAGTTNISTNVATVVTVTPPPPKWDTTFTFGLTVTGGNTKTLLANVDLATQLKTPDNEYIYDVNGAYGENDEVVNAESLDGSAQYNRLATERLYYGIKVEGYHDSIAGIDYRITASPLAGYYLIKNSDTSLVAEIGPGYIYQRDEYEPAGTSTGSDSTSSHATLRLAERFDHKFNANTKIWEKLEIIPEVNNFGNFYADGEIGVSSALSKHTALTTYIDDTYYQVPSAGRLRDDVKLVTGLTYKF